MIATNKDVAGFSIQGKFAMKKKVAKEMPGGFGRPRAIPVSPEQMDQMAIDLNAVSLILAQTAKFCRENNLPLGFYMPAAKVFDEHLPAVLKFCRLAYAEAQPAATAKALGRKTKIERNQEKYDKRKEKE